MPIPNNEGNQDLETINFFLAMMQNLNVIDVSEFTIGARQLAPRDSSVLISYKYNNIDYNFGSGQTKQITDAWNSNLWITTDDGIAYTLQTGNRCSSKAELTSYVTYNELLDASCLAVVVDVNGINKMPNYVEPQSFMESANADKDMSPLMGDQYYIFVARDGITAGSKFNNAAARIISDMK